MGVRKEGRAQQVKLVRGKKKKRGGGVQAITARLVTARLVTVSAQSETTATVSRDHPDMCFMRV